MKVFDKFKTFGKVYNAISDSVGYTVYDELGGVIDSGLWADFEQTALAQQSLDFEGLIFVRTSDSLWATDLIYNAVHMTQLSGKQFEFNNISYITKYSTTYSFIRHHAPGYCHTLQVSFFQESTDIGGGGVHHQRSATFGQTVLGDGEYRDWDYDLGTASFPGGYTQPGQNWSVDMGKMTQARSNERNFEQSVYDLFNFEFGSSMKNFIDALTGTEFDQMAFADKISLMNHRMQSHNLSKMVELMDKASENFVQVSGEELGTKVVNAIKDMAFPLLESAIDGITGNLKVEYQGETKTLPEIIVMILNGLTIY